MRWLVEGWYLDVVHGHVEGLGHHLLHTLGGLRRRPHHQAALVRHRVGLWREAEVRGDAYRRPCMYTSALEWLVPENVEEIGSRGAPQKQEERVKGLTDCVSRYMCIWDPPLTLPLTTRVDPVGSASARARA